MISTSKRQPPTTAHHARNSVGNAHIVEIQNLRVLIEQREGCWFAQGLEIDYATEGRDLDDVRRAFEYGLAATIAVHLREYRSIEGLLKAAPRKVLEKAEAGAVVNRYTQLSAHVFPFHIEFLQAA